MHLRAIIAIARKDALDILVNRSTLFALLTPIFLAALFAFLGQVIGQSTQDILIYNPGNSPLASAIGTGFSNPKFVAAGSPAEVAAAFGADGAKKTSSYTVGLVIPLTFDQRLHDNQHPTVQLYVNGDRSSPQQRDLLTAVIANYARHVAAPTDPVQVEAALINPPPPNDLGAELRTFYALAAAMSTLFVGLSIVANMVVEERERKTLRMLLIAPASMVDILIGKSAVALGYQLAIILLALAITGGFVGQVGLTLAFVLIGTTFTLALGLLAAGIFQTTSATGAFSGVAGFIFIVPVFFVAPFFSAGDNAFVTLIKYLPTFYIGEGMFHALTDTTTAAPLITELVVSIGSTAVLFALAVWALRRQTAVIATA